MLFWYAHHRWSRRYGLEDAGSAVFTMLLIFVVLVYVYPLKAIYSGALEFFSAGYLESYFEMTSVDDVRSMFYIFGTGYIAMSGVIVLLNRHALGKSEELSLSASERYDTVTEIQHWIINMAVPTVSIVLAATLPGNLVALSGLFYAVFGIVLPWHHIRREKARCNVS